MFIHVNTFRLKHNRKNKNLPNLPPIVIRKNRSQILGYSETVYIKDKSGEIVASVVYKPNNPLSCGAVCWIETKYPVQLEEISSVD